MEDKRCGTCQFWGNDGDSRESHRQCTKIEHDIYGHPEYGGIDDAMVDRLAVVNDASGYMAVLRCRSDFGCVLYSPRTQQQAESSDVM